MKKIFTKLFVAMFILATTVNSAFALSESVTLRISNLDMGYDTYNPDTKTFSGIYFSVGADGTNSQNFSKGFTVHIIMLPKAATELSQGTIVWTDVVPDEKLHQFGSWTYENLTIDLNQVQGLVSGEYYLYAYIEEYPKNYGAFSDEVIVFSTGPAKTKADLQVVSLSYDFDPGFGDIANIVIKIINNGETNAAASQIKITINQVMDGGTSGGSTTISLPSVAAKATIEFKPGDLDLTQMLFSYNPDDQYNMILNVDQANSVSESNENNNIFTRNDIASITGVEESLEDLGIIVPNPISKEALAALSKNNMIKSIKVYSLKGEVSDISGAKEGTNLVEFNTIKGISNMKLVLE